MGLRLKMLGIGFGNFVMANRLVAVIAPGSAPVKRIRDIARDKGLLVDATCGRKTRSILILDSQHVVLSAIHPETVHSRLAAREESLLKDEETEELLKGEGEDT